MNVQAAQAGSRREEGEAAAGMRPITHAATEPGGRRRAAVIGVVNVTPDSFSDGGAYADRCAAIAHAFELARAGADVVDIGGESTRPGADPVPAEVEQDRVLEVVRAVAAAGVAVSVDTMHAATAAAAVAAGAAAVNDVSGGLADPGMLDAVATLGCQVVLGHMRATPKSMARHARYGDVVAEVVAELRVRVAAAVAAGVAHERIVVDPGIGFAKDAGQNWQILRRLDALRDIGCPVLVGVSRKRFLAGLAEPGTPAAGRDAPSAVLAALLAERGADALRVHNVAATVCALAALHRLAPPPR